MIHIARESFTNYFYVTNVTIEMSAWEVKDQTEVDACDVYVIYYIP